MQYTLVPPPDRGEHDDPRDMLWVCVDDLIIDPVVQRALQYKSPVWRTEWTWNRAEIVTVASRDGKLFVVEGQNRVEKRKLIAPGSHLWAVLAPESGREAEAAAALGITRGRKKHSPIDVWKLAAEAGGAHENAAEQVLADFGLSVSGDGNVRNGIAAVTSLSLIIRSRGKTPEQGAALLEKVMKVITGAYDREDSSRFEGSMIRGIADVIESNPGRKLDIQRLTDVVARRTPDKWLLLAKDAANVHGEPNVWLFVSREVIREYNKGKRKGSQYALAWSREGR